MRRPATFNPVPTFSRGTAPFATGAEARGGRGPSLLGPAYAHGIDDPSVTRTIRDGFEEGGMPAFGEVLSELQIAGLSHSCVRSARLRPPHPPGRRCSRRITARRSKGVVKTELHDFRVEAVAKAGEPYAFALPAG